MGRSIAIFVTCYLFIIGLCFLIKGSCQYFPPGAFLTGLVFIFLIISAFRADEPFSMMIGYLIWIIIFTAGYWLIFRLLLPWLT